MPSRGIFWPWLLSSPTSAFRDPGTSIGWRSVIQSLRLAAGTQGDRPLVVAWQGQSNESDVYITEFVAQQKPVGVGA